MIWPLGRILLEQTQTEDGVLAGGERERIAYWAGGTSTAEVGREPGQGSATNTNPNLETVN